MRTKTQLILSLLVIAACASVSAASATYRVYATREGLVGHTTANGHVITSTDRFVALPSRTVLNSNGGTTYTVSIRNPANGRTANNVPVWDIGPWNLTDNYWHNPRVSKFASIAVGTPAASVQYSNRTTAEDGLVPSNPAGIDLAEGTWADLAMSNNGYVDVTYNWESTSTAHEYYGVRLNTGMFQAKDGISGLWNDMLAGTTAIQMEGTRLAGVAGGTLYGKDSFGATWSSLIGNVSKFQLKGNRIGVLGTDGTLLAKDGLGGTWATLVGGVSSFQLDGNRIGAMTGNTLIVKDGLSGTWSTLTGNDVSRFKLNGNRIAILTTSGTLLAKDTLGGTWSSLLANVTDFDLTGDRIAAISGGALLVKDGLGGTWSTLTGTDIVKLKVNGNRITAVNQAGSLLAKDGVGGVWYTEIGGVSDFLLDGDRIGVLGTNGTFSVKYGLTGSWSSLAASVTAITMTSTQ